MIARAIVSELRGLDARRLPEDVREVARQSLLDGFGVAVTGAREPLVATLLAEARRHGGNPLCTVIGHGERTSPALAALINGAAADAADFSDALLAIHGHPTAAVMAAALAVTEERDGSGADLLAAFVAGVEAECRVGLLVNPELYTETGFHPTGTLVHFGAAAAAAHAMRLDEAQWGYTLGIAATQAAGLKASAGTMAKPTHCGFAAMHGVMGAGLAKAGFVSNPDAIDGFAATHSPARHEDAVRAAQGRFMILETRVKKHATCALTHSTLENMLKLRPADAAAIESVRLEVPAGHLQVVGKRHPRTELEAKFSLWNTAAMVLLGDDTSDLHAFGAGRFDRPAVTALMDRIEVRERADLDFSVAHATLQMKDGRRVEAVSDTSQPERNLPLRRRQVQAKFRALAEPVLGASKARALEEAILGVEKLPSIRKLLALVAP